MRSHAQVLAAWHSGHVTSAEAMEMTGAWDVRALDALAREHGATSTSRAPGAKPSEPREAAVSRP